MFLIQNFIHGQLNLISINLSLIYGKWYGTFIKDRKYIFSTYKYCKTLKIYLYFVDIL